MSPGRIRPGMELDQNQKIYSDLLKGLRGKGENQTAKS